MPAKNKRRDAKRDENEPEIVRALESEGHYVERIDEPGDLVVWNHEQERWHVLEVKMPDGRLTPRQREFRKDHPDIPVPIVRTDEEAKRTVAGD